MAIERQQNWLGNQRGDIPHFRSIESSIAADFDVLAGTVMTGAKAYVVNGFNVVMTPSPVSGAASNLLVNVAGGVLMHPLATESGTIFQVSADRTTEQLTSTNTRVSGAFISSSTNYVGVDIRRSADSTTSDTVMFLDPITLQEAPKIVPLARTLDYVLVISTIGFSSTPGICPIAKVTTDANNNVTAVVDCRQMMFRLGSGGVSPNIQNTYSWPAGRSEKTTADVFYGGDKGIGNFKAWMDAVMSRIQESNGGQYWYSPIASTNIKLVGTSPFSSGDSFSWDAGPSLLGWQGLKVIIPNSPATYNTITDGTFPGFIDGYCAYVDLNFNSNDTLAMQVGAYTTLGAPAAGTIRFVIAWRLGSYVYSRNGNWSIGNNLLLLNIATASSNGIVTMLTAPSTATTTTPYVPTVDYLTKMIVSGGLSRKNSAVGGGSLTGGAITIGNDVTLDTGVAIGNTSATTLIKGTCALDTLTAATASFITCSTSIQATASAATYTGLTGIGNTTGAGGSFTGGTTGISLRAIGSLATNWAPVAVFYGAGSTPSPRGLIDHNGFKMGRVSEFREEWMAADSSPTAVPTTPVTTLFGSRWSASAFAHAGSCATSVDPAISARYARITSGTTAADQIQLGTVGSLFYCANNQSVVAEWEAYVGDTTSYYTMGFVSSNPGTTYIGSLSGGGSYMMFCNGSPGSGVGTWTGVMGTEAGAGSITSDATANFTANTTYRFRIEIHCSGTNIATYYGGATVLFFVNETLIAHSFTSVPVATNYYFGSSVQYKTGPGVLTMSPVLIVYNRVSNGSPNIPLL